MVFLIGRKDLANMSHGVYGGFKIRMQAQTDSCIHGCAQAGGFVYVRLGGRQAEQVSGDLQCTGALRTAP